MGFLYDDAGRLLSLTHQSITGTIGSYVYAYDDTGRRTGAVEIGRVMTYTYDALYRLTDAVESTGDVYHYEYDAAGNRLLKVEPGVNQAATYDAANQLLTFDGAAVQHDNNGNLTGDGVFSYSYNSLDQLISVSDGSSSTLYGYNGDGDRLWQNTDGISTTFLLDLNGALAQVLAQTPHTTGGATTYFVPGTAGQQTLSAWSYLHMDGLGSVRHLSDASGQVLGNLRYSPFGELVEMSGPTPMFGFSGEQQDFDNNLVYLRARYYNAALGRFLTPDSLIPDITNGQSLNAYAYVYNDPINLVDPSGNIPDVGSAIVWGAQHAPASWKPGIHNFASDGLHFLNWWNQTPDACACQGNSSPLVGWLALGPQAAWAYASEPAERYGTKVVEALVDKQVPGFWRRLPLIRSLPGKWGYKTIQVWEVSGRMSGSLNQLQGPGMPRKDGLHYTGADGRYTLKTKFRVKWGPKGVGGTAALAGIIDGVFQFASDAANPCLAWGQRFNRAALATVFGLVAGAAGAVAFGIFAAGTAPAWVPIAAGFLVGAGAGIALAPYKQKLFENYPQHFGG